MHKKILLKAACGVYRVKMAEGTSSGAVPNNSQSVANGANSANTQTFLRSQNANNRLTYNPTSGFFELSPEAVPNTPKVAPDPQATSSPSRFQGVTRRLTYNPTSGFFEQSSDVIAGTPGYSDVKFDPESRSLSLYSDTVPIRNTDGSSIRLKPLSPFIKEPPVTVPSGPKPMRFTRDPNVKSFKMYTTPYEPDPGGFWAKGPRGGRWLGTALPIGAGFYDVVQANQSQKDLREAWNRGDHIGSNGTIVNAANLANAGVDIAAILAQLGGYNNAAMWFSKPIFPATAAVAGYQAGAGSVEDYIRRTERIFNGKGLVPALDRAIARTRSMDPAAGNTDDEIRAHNVKVRGGEIKQLKDNPDYVPRASVNPLTQTLSGEKNTDTFSSTLSALYGAGGTAAMKPIIDSIPRTPTEKKLMRNNLAGGFGNFIEGTGKTLNWASRWIPPFNWSGAISRYFYNMDPYQPMVDYGRRIQQNSASQLEGAVSHLYKPSDTVNQDNPYGAHIPRETSDSLPATEKAPSSDVDVTELQFTPPAAEAADTSKVPFHAGLTPMKEDDPRIAEFEALEAAAMAEERNNSRATGANQDTP